VPAQPWPPHALFRRGRRALYGAGASTSPKGPWRGKPNNGAETLPSSLGAAGVLEPRPAYSRPPARIGLTAPVKPVRPRKRGRRGWRQVERHVKRLGVKITPSKPLQLSPKRGSRRPYHQPIDEGAG
jgi:hypothetical protein